MHTPRKAPEVRRFTTTGPGRLLVLTQMAAEVVRTGLEAGPHGSDVAVHTTWRASGLEFWEPWCIVVATNISKFISFPQEHAITSTELRQNPGSVAVPRRLFAADHAQADGKAEASTEQVLSDMVERILLYKEHHQDCLGTLGVPALPSS